MAHIRILVTGTRGKSGVVRLLHAAFGACGLRAWGRITGVVPRELTPLGVRRILRTSPASVAEMRWWLGTLPPEADAIIMENSAVAPDLQPLAARWLAPTLVVWTNAFADHQDAWGPDALHAARALAAGIPDGAWVVAGPGLFSNADALGELERKGCRVHVAPEEPGEDVGEVQRHTALTVCELLGLNRISCLGAMRALPRDIGDFRILRCGPGRLASAFAANEPDSSERLFEETRWRREETVLWYHHRRDRTARLQGFLPWLDAPWLQVVLTGAHPFGARVRGQRLGFPEVREMRRFLGEAERVFGCGNIAGLPLALLESLTEEEETS